NYRSGARWFCLLPGIAVCCGCFRHSFQQLLPTHRTKAAGMSVTAIGHRSRRLLRSGIPTRTHAMPTLQGKTLFITGASRGIGLAIALRAARDGANVAIAAKSAVPNPKLPGTIHSAAAAVEAA